MDSDNNMCHHLREMQHDGVGMNVGWGVLTIE